MAHHQHPPWRLLTHLHLASRYCATLLEASAHGVVDPQHAVL
jgi:hypothetical protein